MAESCTEIIYASASRQPFSPRQLTELLAKARASNQALAVSGLLLYHQGSFLQVLEGEDSVLSALYERITKDPRHHRCMVVKRSTVMQRSFADWSMGFVEVSAAVAKQLEGFNMVLQQGFVGLGQTASAEAIRKVVYGFRAGQWRQHVV
ncbi:MAG TPA: BLUF domain-containing protein [Polyangia bacterium]|jgi:hypothetical protein|nr:BLUF domain-containing protein [Polyangia bacterium]